MLLFQGSLSVASAEEIAGCGNDEANCQTCINNAVREAKNTVSEEEASENDQSDSGKSITR